MNSSTTSTTPGALAISDRFTESASNYLLVCQATSTDFNCGVWQFSLESSEGVLELEASDEEVGDLNRLTLMAAMRGLEAIEGASAVTLLSNNRYLIRSLSDALPRWRANNYVWEHFGRRIDVQHADLWRRVDRALSIHRVEACLISSRLVSGGTETQVLDKDDDVQLRIDGAHSGPPLPRHANKPKDGLRRWLLGGATSLGSPPAKHRFTAADLAGTS